jgi:AcrR family transcriptional regulator
MTSQTTPQLKRTSRGEPVIKGVLDAAREELAKVGYRALRIEDVAARAKVHKTTIYRRWPTKVELVHETLLSMFEENFSVPNTGTLRGDFLALAKLMLAFLATTSGQCLVRLMMTEGNERELQRIVESLRSVKEAPPRQIVAAAMARGELREGVSPDVLMCGLAGAMHHRIFALGVPPGEVEVEPIIDLLLYGALPRVGEPTPTPIVSAKPKAKRKGTSKKKAASG